VSVSASVLVCSGDTAATQSFTTSPSQKCGRARVVGPGIAEVYLALGEQNRAFEWFDRAVDERSNMLVTLQSSHRYDAVRQDGRFQQLVDRVGLWRA